MITTKRDLAATKYDNAALLFYSLNRAKTEDTTSTWSNDFIINGNSLGEARRELRRSRSVFFLYCSIWEKLVYLLREPFGKVQYIPAAI